jgi:hypothetical protein
VNQGSSLLAMIELGKQKGYELVCTLGCNAFFVPREYFALFGIENNHIDAMFDDTRTETRVFQCYDGTLVLAGKKSLNWHKIDFCDEDIQILPASLRRYGKRLDVSPRPDERGRTPRDSAMRRPRSEDARRERYTLLERGGHVAKRRSRRQSGAAHAVFVQCLMAQAKRHRLKDGTDPGGMESARRPSPAREALRFDAHHPFCSVRIVEVPAATTLAIGTRRPCRVPDDRQERGHSPARGRFVLATNVDIVFSDPLFAAWRSRIFSPGAAIAASATMWTTHDVRDACRSGLDYCQSH